MKTIAAAAILMMLAVPASADDSEKQTNDPANSNEPIVLSEAEMDGVTAGITMDGIIGSKTFQSIQKSGDSAKKDIAMVFQSYALYPH